MHSVPKWSKCDDFIYMIYLHWVWPDLIKAGVKCTFSPEYKYKYAIFSQIQIQILSYNYIIQIRCLKGIKYIYTFDPKPRFNPIGPWKIWKKFQISNIWYNFSDWWVRYLVLVSVDPADYKSTLVQVIAWCIAMIPWDIWIWFSNYQGWF